MDIGKSCTTGGEGALTDGRTPRIFPEDGIAVTEAWYIVQTKPHKEAFVESRLEELAVEVFLPRIVERVRAGLTLQRRISPMFPSYLFTRLAIDSLGKTVRYTHGVRDFVRFGGPAQPVAPEIVEALRWRTWPNGVCELPPVSFQPGERLQISDGPLRGLEVIFEREMNGPERVAVLLAEVKLAARIILRAEALSKPW